MAFVGVSLGKGRPFTWTMNTRSEAWERSEVFSARTATLGWSAGLSLTSERNSLRITYEIPRLSKLLGL